ncbi:MAG: transcription elongation factor GreB [Burkholderiales bacterium]
MRRLDLIERDRAFKAQQAGDEAQDGALPPGTKHYMTPGGHARLKAEVEHLLNTERPALVKVVTWAASNGDRSENADYQYGKRRLREIDRRIRYLAQRLDGAEVIDPARPGLEQVFFGATVTYADGQGVERTVSIVGADEVDTARGRISWLAPVARALTKAREGDTVRLRTPGGEEGLEIIAVRYVPLGD